MKYTIKNFQKVYLAPLPYKPSLSNKPPSRVLEINKPPGGLNREFTVIHPSTNQIEGKSSLYFDKTCGL